MCVWGGGGGGGGGNGVEYYGTSIALSIHVVYFQHNIIVSWWFTTSYFIFALVNL